MGNGDSSGETTEHRGDMTDTNDSGYVPKEKRDNPAQTIREEREEKAKMNKHTRYGGRISMLVGLALIIVIPIILISILVVHQLFASLMGLFLAYGVLLIIGSLWLGSIYRTREHEIEDLDFKIDLEKLGGDANAIAMKQLRNNDLQLRRYYDQNLGQNDRVFYLGILCIFLGIGVVGATFYLVKVTDSANAQIVTGVIGGVGAIMTNFVAAIYLMMHRSVAKNLGTFHAKLVDTHRILLALLAASRIENTADREETLRQLAIALAREPRETDRTVHPASPPTAAS